MDTQNQNKALGRTLASPSMFIANCDVGDRQYIAQAYQDARVLVAGSSADDPAGPKITITGGSSGM